MADYPEQNQGSWGSGEGNGSGQNQQGQGQQGQGPQNPLDSDSQQPYDYSGLGQRGAAYSPQHGYVYSNDASGTGTDSDQTYYQAADPTQQQTAVSPDAPVVAGGGNGNGGDGGKGHKGHKGLGGNGRSALFGVLGGVCGAVVLVLVLMGTGVIKFGSSSSSSSSSSTSDNGTINITTSDEDASTAEAVAAKAMDSVVSVYVTTDEGEGLGSGVILDTDGDIITNYHVIDGATDISVTISGKSYSASVVGSDSSSDIAVIKADLQGDSVTPIEVGDSDELNVGSWVMTIGSPFGLDQSVSTGVVSALYRNTMLESSSGETIYANLIQVDAAINPGNSGGALVNDQGQLVGICTLYSSDTESFAGIGFAIPGNYAVNIAQQIINGETVTHAYIGLTMQTVNATNARYNNLSVNQGAYVTAVTEGSPADEAGIEAGDIVIAVDGEEITSASGMILEVRSHDIGDTITVTVMRGDQQMDFEVTLGSDEALQEQQNSSTVSDNSTTDSTNSTNGLDTNSQFEQWIQERMQNDYSNTGSSSSSDSSTSAVASADSDQLVYVGTEGWVC
ncbi:MAG: S1C family serine protease [Tractidigestivibacter sp.]|jgi:putative serine protease PepD|uniref:S1C family serine protease n=1 Tax=Tractidigestivibacter sp. TaxID=2847320 RepID=UPI003D93E517